MVDSIKTHVAIEKARDTVSEILKLNDIKYDDTLVDTLIAYISGLQKEILNYDEGEDQIQYLLRIILCNAAMMLNDSRE